MTLVRHRLADVEDAALAGVTVVAQLDPMPGFFGATTEIVARAEVLTDEYGGWSLDLTPNELITPAGTTYLVSVRGHAHRIQVPDLDEVDFYDCLVDIVDDIDTTFSLTRAEGDASYSPLGHSHSGAGSHTHAEADVTGLVADLAAKSPSSHNHSGVYDPVGTASTAIGTHEAASDPHPGYQRENEKAQASGYASLDSSTKVPVAQLPTGSSASTVAIGNDSRLSDARTPLPHAASHASAGGDAVTPAAIGAATTGHNHSGTYDPAGTAAAAVAAIPSDGSAGTASLRTLGTGATQAATGNHSHGSSGGLKDAYSSGPTSAWTAFSGGAGSGSWSMFPTQLRITVDAAVGDIIDYEVAAISNGGDAELDCCSVVGGSPARYYSSGTAIQGSNGHGGLYVAGDYGHAKNHRVLWVVTGDDISAGQVTLAMMYRGSSGRTWTHTSGAYPATATALCHAAPA